MSQHPGSHFLIISSVLFKDGSDNYEQLVQWGEFGSKFLDTYSIGQMLVINISENNFIHVHLLISLM